MYGPPGPNISKYLDRVRSTCCSRVVNCTKMEGQGFFRPWDDTLLTGVMNQAYKLRLSLPKPHTCQSRGARWKLHFGFVINVIISG